VLHVNLVDTRVIKTVTCYVFRMSYWAKFLTPYLYNSNVFRRSCKTFGVQKLPITHH